MGTHRFATNRTRAAGRCFTRRRALRSATSGLAAITLTAAGLRATPAPAQAQEATPETTLAPSPGDLVDIGGRNIYLECQGDPERGPVIVLLTGYRTSGRYWTDDLLHPVFPRHMVLPSLAKAARVCTYDRPGTYAYIAEDLLTSRSDAIDQPRRAADVVEELHTLLQAAKIPGPYILAAHSLGGLFARLYAATYPDEVVGMVLVDAYSELLENVMTPAQYAALKELNQAGGTDDVLEIDGYGEVEAFPWGGDNETVREAVAASPLRPMPLAVLSHGKPFPGTDDVPGFAPGELEELLQAGNRALAALVPNSRFWVASESGHDIHQDQPELVTEAIQQVLEGVRSPDTWYSLESCCAE
ncbi:MAG: alpha/beta hydrolase [Thermomicrobiales bacterium]